MWSLCMSDEAKKLLADHEAAKRGDAYKEECSDQFFFSFFKGPLVMIVSSVLTWMCFLAAEDCFTRDLLNHHDFYSPLWGVFFSVLVVVVGLLALVTFMGTTGSWKQCWMLIFGEKYAQRRLPEEEALLQDKLVLNTVELNRQVKLYETLRSELEIQNGLAEAGLPTDIDVVRGRVIAQALYDDIAPKLMQLDALIKRRARKAEGEEVDLSAMREILGDRHGDVIAQLKTEQELGGDPAVQALHSAISNDDLNTELGDAAAFARKLAAKRQTQ